MVVSRSVLFYVPHGLKRQELKIGESVRISENVEIDCSSKVSIGNNVWISQNVQIFNHRHIIDGIEFKKSKNIELMTGIEIGDDAWIGASAIILPDVTKIGKGAIVGAGSVLTHSIDDYEIWAGNPARKIGSRV